MYKEDSIAPHTNSFSMLDQKVPSSHLI